MSFEDKRNVLRIGPPEHPGETEITSAMVETVRQRIKDAGGILTVWAVLDEDVYESQFGDGFYLHVQRDRAEQRGRGQARGARPAMPSSQNGMCGATGSG